MQDQSADEALASVPPPIVRGDLLWQLTPSTMAWSGGPLPLSDDDDRRLAFSIRHAITGMFLCEEVSAAKKGTAAADDAECAVGLAAVDTHAAAPLRAGFRRRRRGRCCCRASGCDGGHARPQPILGAESRQRPRAVSG
jgi:hypothetical protein